MGVIDSIIFNTFEGIYKAIVANQSCNWYQWCTLLFHPGVKDTLLEILPQEDKAILISSFTSLLWQNQFGTTNKKIFLHITVKAVILYVSASFRTYLWNNLALDASLKESHILKRQIRGYKKVDHPTKHKKIYTGRYSVPHLQKTTLKPNLIHFPCHYGILLLSHTAMQIIFNS